MSNQLTVPLELIDKLYGYLSQKPYGEVNQFLKGFEEAYKQYVKENPPIAEDIIEDAEIVKDEVISTESEKALLKAHGVVSE